MVLLWAGMKGDDEVDDSGRRRRGGEKIRAIVGGRAVGSGCELSPGSGELK